MPPTILYVCALFKKNHALEGDSTHRLAATTAARFPLGCGGAASGPPWGAATSRHGALAPCSVIRPRWGLGGVPPAPLRSARGTASQRSPRHAAAPAMPWSPHTDRGARRGSQCAPGSRGALPRAPWHKNVCISYTQGLKGGGTRGRERSAAATTEWPRVWTKAGQLYNSIITVLHFLLAA